MKVLTVHFAYNLLVHKSHKSVFQCDKATNCNRRFHDEEIKMSVFAVCFVFFFYFKMHSVQQASSFPYLILDVLSSRVCHLKLKSLLCFQLSLTLTTHAERKQKQSWDSDAMLLGFFFSSPKLSFS